MSFARYAVPLFKLLVIPAALGILATQVVNDPRLGLLNLDPVMLVAALAVNQVALFLFAVRMQAAMRGFGIVLTVAQALRVHLQSIFYFFVLPMTVGLEVARFTKIRNLLGEAARAGPLTYALLADRLAGALAALALALASWPFVEFTGWVRWGLTPAGLIWVGAGIGIVLLLAMRRRVRAHLVELVELCRTGRRGLWVALGVSLATHCCFAFGIHLAARAAHLEIGFAQALFAVSAAMLFVVLPVSFAGVSPVEAAGLGVLVSMGIPVDQAAIFVLLSYLAKVVGAFEGAAWEIFEGGHDASRGLFDRETPSSKAPGKL